MLGDFVYKTDLRIVFLLIFAVLSIAQELAYQWGRRRRLSTGEENNTIIELIPTSILGLLALLLGFTFSMALSRFDLRKSLIIKEMNSIGSTSELAGLLNDPNKTQLQSLLNRYQDLRIQVFEPSTAPDQVQKLNAEIQSLQREMWDLTAQLTKVDRSAVAAGFAKSLTQVMDVEGERSFAGKDQVPATVYLVIFLITIAGLCSLSSILGNRKIGRSSLIMLTALFSVVIVLIQDIDRSYSGWIRIDQKRLLSK